MIGLKSLHMEYVLYRDGCPQNPTKQHFPSFAAMFLPVQAAPSTTQQFLSQSTVNPTRSQGDLKVRLIHTTCVAYFEKIHSRDRMVLESCFSSTHFIYYDICVMAGVTQYHHVPIRRQRDKAPNTLSVHLRQGVRAGCHK